MESGVGGLAKAAYKTLYRAVNSAELAELRSSGIFRNIEGIESKYFEDSLQGARSYADQALKAFGDVLTVVQTRIPIGAITPEMRVTVDRGINAVVVPTSKLHQLASPKVVP